MALPIDPVASVSLPTHKLARMVALSRTFQAETGTDNATDAWERITFKNALGTTLARPYAVISPGDQHSYKLVAGGAQNYLRPSGSLMLFLCRDTAEEEKTDTIEAETAAHNFFAGVLDEVAELAGQDDPTDETSHLNITQIDRVMFDATPEDQINSLGDFWYCGYHVMWGDGD